jgi:hypothetical protein
MQPRPRWTHARATQPTCAGWEGAPGLRLLLARGVGALVVQVWVDGFTVVIQDGHQLFSIVCSARLVKDRFASLPCGDRWLLHTTDWAASETMTASLA